MLTPLPLLTVEFVGDEIRAPEGLLYRTRPRIAVVRERSWTSGQVVIKTLSPEVVLAEALGSVLADLVRLPTPQAGIAILPGNNQPAFCSGLQLRDQVERYLEARRVVNPSVIADTIVFDLWTANDDRNMGGFVARIPDTGAPGEVELLAIDFESCRVLRGESSISINSLPRRHLLPRSDVRRYVGPSIDPRAPYRRMCERIAHVTEKEIRESFERVRYVEYGLFQPVSLPAWMDGAIKQLADRASRIGFIVEEVLHA